MTKNFEFERNFGLIFGENYKFLCIISQYKIRERNLEGLQIEMRWFKFLTKITIFDQDINFDQNLNF